MKGMNLNKLGSVRTEYRVLPPNKNNKPRYQIKTVTGF